MALLRNVWCPLTDPGGPFRAFGAADLASSVAIIFLLNNSPERSVECMIPYDGVV